MILRVCCVVFLLLCSTAHAQFKPKLEFGSIVSLTYLNGESEMSPLGVNRGNGTFAANWTLLLGVEINDQLALYAESQTEGGLEFINYGLSAIYRPETNGYANIEFGKFLAPFGNFLRRYWASENPLKVWPLLYDYRTNLSASALPESETELLLARGRGYNVGYHNGQGLRIFSRHVYLTGAQIFGSFKNFSYNLGFTNGALSNPADINNSTGLQMIGRVAAEPFFGLRVGSSFAWGAYLEQSAVEPQLQAISKSADDFRQRALGFDLTYSIGHFEFFGEFVHNRWQSAFVESLDAVAFDYELKYSFLTRFYVAGRMSRIDFQNIADPNDVDDDGVLTESWDFDVNQFEIGLGYDFNRNGLLKVMSVFNRTQDAPAGDPDDDLIAVQMVVSF